MAIVNNKVHMIKKIENVKIKNKKSEISNGELVTDKLRGKTTWEDESGVDNSYPTCLPLPFSFFFISFSTPYFLILSNFYPTSF